ncbi:MAG TPA: 5'/3'-nucleotidase SurE [Alphaproteobacteria bacterium]|nr:5'/3'-nucleotidase SurE [Alphaproteobacteria bacterium]
MRILLVNDDGILAPGLKALERLARVLSKDVWVVAPETEQSAASHSLTLHRPLSLRRISARRWAVNGTPTDCVYLAIHKVFDGKRPDLVLSGVNRGSNIGEDVTYSGTIAAAMEATLLGVPSIALSQYYEDGEHIRWKTAEHWGVKTVRALLKQGWPANVLINVNFPDRAVAKVRGIRAGKQGEHEVFDAFEERIDPRGRTYYWVGQDHVEDVSGAPGTDLRAVNDGYVAVTPLHLDLTHRPTLTRLRKVFN